MSDHTVRAYDQELAGLTKMIAEMGGIAGKMVSDAWESLSNFDAGLAKIVVETDAQLDAKQRFIEQRAIEIICRRQSVACDLRAIVGSIRIAGDLERVGDLAKSIAKRVMDLSSALGTPRCIIRLRTMYELAARQLGSAIDSYIQHDASLAYNVWTSDVDLDDLEDAVFRDLLTFMMEDPRNISFCAHLLFCSKNIERVGDHATNIAETVMYIVTGEIPAIARPRGRSSTWIDAAGRAAAH